METGGNSEESSEPNAGSSEQADDVLVQGPTVNEDSNEGTVAHSVPKKRRKGRPPKALPSEVLGLQVPQHIRDKIKVLLNLKYFEGGCALVSLAIEYEDYYGEELNPRNYGFEDMNSMLNVFPKEELIIKKVGTPSEPRVFAGVPLKKTDRIEALKKIFDPAGQPNIPWRKDEQVIPQIDESCWNDGFLQSILEGANIFSLIDDSNQSLSMSNPVEVSRASPNTKETSARSISLQTETATEPSSGLPDSTKGSNQVTLELADAGTDTSNSPSMEQPGTSRSSGVPQPAKESEPEVSIIVDNPKPEKIVECITIEDSDDDDEESKDSTAVKSKLPSTQPMILPKTEARPIAQVSNRSQTVANFVETLRKKGQSKTGNNQSTPKNPTNKYDNSVSAASSKDTSTVEKSTSSQVNTRSRET